MEKEFLSYTQALALKELRFDEPCLAYYNTEKLFKFPGTTMYNRNFLDLLTVTAPLKQQALKFFRDKQGMHHGIGFNGLWYYDIQSMKDTENAVYEVAHKWDISTYEEAEQSCLDKLIEIVKNGK